MPMKTPVLTLFLGLVAALPATADMYKYVDKDGHVTYSNIPIKGAKRINLDPLNTVPASKARPASSGNAGPSDFPKVDGATQQKRDDMRRKVLQDELNEVQKRLEEAKKALAEQESVRLGGERNYQKYLDRIQPYKDEVARQEKNVEALQKELATTR